MELRELKTGRRGGKYENKNLLRLRLKSFNAILVGLKHACLSTYTNTKVLKLQG